MVFLLLVYPKKKSPEQQRVVYTKKIRCLQAVAVQTPDA
jgi:hypothetical protein